ncbi:hypothetical protein [Thermaurantiacus sp.]
MKWLVVLALVATALPADARWRRRAVGPELRNHGADARAIPGCTRAAAEAGAALPFGCANGLNLEAMLAEPAHLEVAAPLPLPVGEPATAARKALRTGRSAPLPGVSTRAEPER